MLGSRVAAVNGDRIAIAAESGGYPEDVNFLDGLGSLVPDLGNGRLAARQIAHLRFDTSCGLKPALGKRTFGFPFRGARNSLKFALITASFLSIFVSFRSKSV